MGMGGAGGVCKAERGRKSPIAPPPLASRTVASSRDTAPKRPLSRCLFCLCGLRSEHAPAAVPAGTVIDQTIGCRSTWNVCRNSTCLFTKTGVRIEIGVETRGEEMARNFGVPQTGTQTVRGSLWPLMLVAFVLTGIINVAVHLRLCSGFELR